MQKKFLRKDVLIIIIIFVVSRTILSCFGIGFDYSAIFRYWQYLDIETLRHNLLAGIWYDHAQPPVFNLFIGIVLKLSGSYAQYVFAVIFKLITLVNTLLLFIILKKLIHHSYFPLIISLFYLLSPATMVFENELFYTTFVSMLLLACCYFILQLQEKSSWNTIVGIFLPLAIICLTRSMYHWMFLAFVSAIILFVNRKSACFNRLFLVSSFFLLIVGSWYVKNYFIFGKLSTSTWIGMNMSRNVFHDAMVTDSSKIESIPPFSKISVYKPFISENYKKEYAGLNDRDLLLEMKNDSFINTNNAGYIEVSNKYLVASKNFIKSHPVHYLKNVLQSAIIFFAPATRYSVTEKEAQKIKYYDLLYSFNLSQLANGKQQRRIALSISAIPKILIYLITFSLLIRQVKKSKKIDLLNLFVLSLFAYVFVIGSLLEHYENMRFRFEIEPLFLLLIAQTVASLSFKVE